MNVGELSTCSQIPGDGIIIGNEECDDANIDNDDGCNSTMEIETGWECPVAGSPCNVICGDGLTVGTENCDDGSDDGIGC